MKKVILGLAMFGFVAGTALTVSAIDKDKKEKKTSCCSKKDEKACDKKDGEKKSCCSKKSDKKSCDAKKTEEVKPSESSK